MNIYKVAVIVGSTSKKSTNMQFAKALIKLAPENLEFNFLDIAALPMYNHDFDADMPAEAKLFKENVRAADAILFVTPEYNRAIPGVLKNALDTASRPAGDNSWSGKPAAVIGASISPIGTALAQNHLRSCVTFLDILMMNQPEAYIKITDNFYNSDGTIGEGSEDFLRNWMKSFAAWIEKMPR
ncbi:MAG: NAD(P)H-dependent oxidoreductase [Lentisphaerae bacterium]|jgi:chromate reductase|nr:NAD(P)H-dependent oxidoreductase [Lentisphaerota bacterium]